MPGRRRGRAAAGPRSASPAGDEHVPARIRRQRKPAVRTDARRCRDDVPGVRDEDTGHDSADENVEVEMRTYVVQALRPADHGRAEALHYTWMIRCASLVRREQA